MKNRIAIKHPGPELRKKTTWALVELGLWLRIGYLGTFGLVTGLLLLFDAQVKPLSALGLAFSGAALAVISGWRGRAILAIVDEVVAVPSGVSSPASAAASGMASPPSSLQGGRSLMTDAAPRFAATQAEVSS
jgi:hypothetical protein